MRTGLVISLSCNLLLILLRYSTGPDTEARRQASSGRMGRPRCCFCPTEDSENDAVWAEGVGVKESEGEQEEISTSKISLVRKESLRALNTRRKASIQCQLEPTTTSAPSSAAL